MNRSAIAFLIAMSFAASAAAAQDVIETSRGTYRVYMDDLGRYSRLEDANGIVGTYLYDSPAAKVATGLCVRINDKVALTVHYDAEGTFWTPGLPKLKTIEDADHRTIEIRADGTAIARFQYASDRSIAAVALPGHVAMQLTPSGRNHQVHQTLVDATGAVLAKATVISSAGETGIWKKISFDGLVSAIGFEPRPFRLEHASDDYMLIVRDEKQHPALYIVTVGDVSVGFTPDGVPRFYEIAAQVFDTYGTMFNDSGVPNALDQKLAAPSYVTLTADGRPGFYVEEPGNGAIYAAWVEKRANGRGTVPAFARATAERLNPE